MTRLQSTMILHSGVKIPAGEQLQRRYPLLNPDQERTGASIHEPTEKEIVRQLFSSPTYRSLILQNLKLNPEVLADVLLEVGEPVTRRGSKPGDVDVLIHRMGAPRCSIGIEAKRVEIYAEEKGKDNAYRLHKISKAVEQGQGLVEMGFYQAYVAVILLVDALPRSQENGNVFHSLAATHTYTTILRNLSELSSHVGIIVIEVVQPGGQPFQEMGSIVVTVPRLAPITDQKDELTNRINHLYSEKSLLSQYRI